MLTKAIVHTGYCIDNGEALFRKFNDMAQALSKKRLVYRNLFTMAHRANTQQSTLRTIAGQLCEKCIGTVVGYFCVTDMPAQGAFLGIHIKVPDTTTNAKPDTTMSRFTVLFERGTNNLHKCAEYMEKHRDAEIVLDTPISVPLWRYVMYEDE